MLPCISAARLDKCHARTMALSPPQGGAWQSCSSLASGAKLLVGIFGSRAPTASWPGGLTPALPLVIASWEAGDTFRLFGFWCEMPLQVPTILRTVSPRRGPREWSGDEPRPTAQISTTHRVPRPPRDGQGPGMRSELRMRAADAEGRRFDPSVDLRPPHLAPRRSRPRALLDPSIGRRPYRKSRTAGRP